MTTCPGPRGNSLGMRKRTAAGLKGATAYISLTPLFSLRRLKEGLRRPSAGDAGGTQVGLWEVEEEGRAPCVPFWELWTLPQSWKEGLQDSTF